MVGLYLLKDGNNCHIVAEVALLYLAFHDIKSNVLSVVLQIWLADWLLENNPNKPKVKDPTVVEPQD